MARRTAKQRARGKTVVLTEDRSRLTAAEHFDFATEIMKAATAELDEADRDGEPMAPKKVGTRALMVEAAKTVYESAQLYRVIRGGEPYNFLKTSRRLVEKEEVIETPHSITTHFSVKRTDDWPFPNGWLTKTADSWPFRKLPTSSRATSERRKRVEARLRRAEWLMHRAWRDVPMGRFNAVEGTAISVALRGAIPRAALRWRRLVRSVTNTWRSLWAPARPVLPKSGPYR